MAALKGASIERFLASPPENKSAVLIYGPDGGLVRERGAVAAKAITDDLSDPFNYIELADADLKGEPARLVDEAAALSFAGGRRVIRLRTTSDAAAIAAIKNLIDGLDGETLKSNSLVIVEAGELQKSSKLRKLFETARNAVAIACYEDKPDDVRELAIKMAAAEDLRFDQDAVELAVSLLGTDRGVSRSELDKLILYVGPKGQPRDHDVITLTDVKESLVDTVTDALDAVAGAALDGANKRLALALHRSAVSGANSIGLLRALQRSVGRLAAAQDLVAGGTSAADAMKRLRPPVFYTEQRAFTARLRRWSTQKLTRAQNDLLDTECAAKTTGAPQRELVERAAFRLAAMAQRR